MILALITVSGLTFPVLEPDPIASMQAQTEKFIEQHKADGAALEEFLENPTPVEGIEKAKAIIEEYDLDISDVFPNRANKPKSSGSSASKVIPKYRNPENGQTWTGRGKEPLWIAGKDRSLFLI